MTFARWVFLGAGIWGLLVVPPLFFLYDTVGRQDPPAVTHPEFYYGFAAITLAWQLAFLIIASNPVRFRPLMLPSICEKAGYVVVLLVLHAQGRVGPGPLSFGAVDLLLGALFTMAFLRTSAPGAATV